MRLKVSQTENLFENHRDFMTLNECENCADDDVTHETSIFNSFIFSSVFFLVQASFFTLNFLYNS